MATIKDAIKELEELKEKFDEDSEIVMVVFTKDDINLGCEYCNYDDVDEATKLLEGIDWTDVLYQLVSERGIDILGDIIEDLVNGNSPYITNKLRVNNDTEI